MKTNITLIGMPACGKSSIGVVLAKRLGMKFIDCDLIIQEQTGKLLKTLIEENGDDGFRRIEENLCAKLKPEGTVIAPGGSVVYGQKAMENLKKISTVVYLKLGYNELKKRLGDLHKRGVTFKHGQTLADLYEERVQLYEHYADITQSESGKSMRRIVDEICNDLKQYKQMTFPRESDNQETDL